MFFDLVKRNSKRNIKENMLFFTSLIVSIISFYIILSLGNQDVIIFLKTMESDAVNRLLVLTPVLYAISLFILFFLVYFAGEYQLERRNHELGMYLMLGMRRKKLFSMLILEEIYNSIISLIIGIPIAVFITEMISMITAKIVGIGIINHKFSFSIHVILFTCGGYFLIRLVSIFILSLKIAKKEINLLLSKAQDEKIKVHNKIFTSVKLVLGISLLITAYASAIEGESWDSLKNMSITVILGFLGTLILFNSIGIIFNGILKSSKNKNGLEVFTFRQLQENIFLRSNSLAISSILILIALCCFGYGVSISVNSNTKTQNVLHYTFKGEENTIKSELNKKQINAYMNEIFELKTGHLASSFESENDMNSESYQKSVFNINNLIEAVNKTKYSDDKSILLNNLQNFTYPYLISESGYNNILRLSGKDTLNLGENQAALYNGLEFSSENRSEILKSILNDNITIQINNIDFELVPDLYQDNIVTDRSISLSYALIVSDDVFNKLTKENYSSYWNASLKDDFVKENGLMQSIMHINKLLTQTNLEYESYLQNMGRQLFYIVAASYTTIYLAVIFLIIANTVIGVQFLMHAQKTKGRYVTLIKLGCYYDDLCKSVRKQIKCYFSFPIVIAAVSSVFGIRSLFTGALASEMQSKTNTLMMIAIPTIIILCVIEFSYMIAVMKISDKEIHSLMNVKREDN